jgi:hypothetical protein
VLTSASKGYSGPPLERTDNVLAKLIDKIFYSGYEVAKENATMDIVARFSRGNTAVQSGHFLDTPDIEEMRKANKKAIKRLAKLAKTPRRAA